MACVACEKVHWKVAVPRPPTLWLPGAFHELPDSLVTKYMNDYRSGLKARMHFPKVMRELDDMALWCGNGLFAPSYVKNYLPITSKERAQRFRKWLAMLRGPRS